MDTFNKAYEKVREHRTKCKKWGKGFCLECFGGGLSKFIDDYDNAMRSELGLPSIEEQAKDTIKFLHEMERIKEIKEATK